MSTSANRRPTAVDPSVRSVLASQALIGCGVDIRDRRCCEPAAQFVRHRTLHREAAWIGRRENRSVRQLDDCKTRFDASVSVSSRAVEGIEQLPRVPADKGWQNGGGEAVEIGAGQQPEIALLILGEPPEDDLRRRDGDGDHQAGHQHGDLYNQWPGGDVPQPHHQGAAPLGSSALPLAPDPVAAVRRETQCPIQLPIAE